MAERSTYRVGCPSWVFGLRASEGARLLLVRLWAFVDGAAALAFLDGEGPAPFVWACRDGMARDLETSVRSVQRRLVELEKAGAVRRSRQSVRGRFFDGFELAAEPPIISKKQTCPQVQGDSSVTPTGHERHPWGDSSVAPTRQQRRQGVTAASSGGDSSVTRNTPVNTQENPPENTEQVASAGRATSPPADPEPLTLELAEPDALDPTRLARHVLEASVAARKALGAGARVTAVSAGHRQAVLGLAKAFDEPVIFLVGGPVDLRSEGGLRRAWDLAIARKLEELRRRAEARAEDPAALACWLRLDSLAKDAPQLLADGDDLDERRPHRQRGSPRPGSGPPQNGTDLAAYARLNDEGQFT